MIRIKWLYFYVISNKVKYKNLKKELVIFKVNDISIIKSVIYYKSLLKIWMLSLIYICIWNNYNKIYYIYTYLNTYLILHV